jgi:8-oxo-dGTP pyrophosphatase MutT (NUDIX family)
MPPETPVETASVICFRGQGTARELLLLTPGPTSKHPDGTWLVPGGRLDEGETAREAAARELEEEAGITVLATELRQLETDYTSHLRLKEGPVLMHWVIFTVDVDQEATSTPEGDPHWIPLTALDALALEGNLREAVYEAVADDAAAR